ncbi:MAG: B12-binding domain-containing radical SAM protein [Elusimicrobiales bacterium]|nr:B12-binding domain-containing radical SAM protein [Elusimicrobiales bacterium]
MKVSLALAPMLFRRCPPIGLAYLAAFLRAGGHQVSVLDLNTDALLPEDGNEDSWNDRSFVSGYEAKNPGLLEAWAEKLLAGDPGVVGFSLWNSNRHLTFRLADLVKRRKPGCLVVFGGPHINFENEQLLRRCPAADVLVAGEGESALLELVERCERGESAENCPGTYFRSGGRVCRAAPRQNIPSLDSLPFPDYRDFSLEKYYLPTALPLSFNRGCLRRCEFCNIHADWPAYRHRSAANIYAEMLQQLDRHAGLDHFMIDSSALNQDIRQLEALCDLILAGGRAFVWGGMAMFRPEMTSGLLKKMFAAGCRDLSYGLESGSQKIVDSMRKGFRLEQAAQCLRDTSAAGIEVSLNLIVGAPGETEEDLRATMDFLRANRDCIDFVGSPSEMTLTAGIPLQLDPVKFGIDPGPGAIGTSWSAGGNTHEVRQDRIRRFNDFLSREAIGRFSPQGRLRAIKTEKPG